METPPLPGGKRRDPGVSPTDYRGPPTVREAHVPRSTQTPACLPGASGRASGCGHVTAHVTPGEGLEARPASAWFTPLPVRFASARRPGPANPDSCALTPAGRWPHSSRQEGEHRGPQCGGLCRQPSEAPAASGPATCLSSSHSPPRY